MKALTLTDNDRIVLERWLVGGLLMKALTLTDNSFCW